jgi:hypothetical protein
MIDAHLLQGLKGYLSKSRYRGLVADGFGEETRLGDRS